MISIFLIWIALGLVAAIGVSLVVAAVRRRLLWRTWAALGSALVAVTLAVSELDQPFLEDGPFTGQPRRDCPTRTPDQRFALAGGRWLEAFDAAAGETAATVRLRTRDGGTKWCIYATGLDGTGVEKVRFTGYSRTLLGSTQVDGRVLWTYGDEQAWWRLGPFGGLRAYYFSW